MQLLSSIACNQTFYLGKVRVNFPSYFRRQVSLRESAEKVLRAAFGMQTISWRPMAYSIANVIPKHQAPHKLS